MDIEIKTLLQVPQVLLLEDSYGRAIDKLLEKALRYRDEHPKDNNIVFGDGQLFVDVTADDDLASLKEKLDTQRTAWRDDSHRTYLSKKAAADLASPRGR